MDKAIGVISFLLGLTAVAVILSKKSNTVGVLNSILGGINSLQKTAISPVTGK